MGDLAVEERRVYGENHEGLEAIASYWHMIDLTWIVMFPLLYVFR